MWAHRFPPEYSAHVRIHIVLATFLSKAVCFGLIGSQTLKKRD